MTSSDLPVAPGAPDVPAHLLDRRRFLVIGGAGAATAALLAACGGGGGGSTAIARVGVSPTAAPLPTAVVNDAVVLRTASSIEHSIVDVYDQLIDLGLLDTEMMGGAVTRMRDAHEEFAATFEQLTTAAGGEAWTCGNPRWEDVVLPPILRAITGAAATDTLPEVPPSDDPRRDAIHLVHALETVGAATYQGMMQQLSVPELRGEAIVIGAREARHSALLAIAIGGPSNYVDPATVEAATLESTTTMAAAPSTQDIATPDTEPQTGESTNLDTGSQATPASVPPVYAQPGEYGLLSPVQLVVGAPNENGVRLTVNLETPSLNTFVYEYFEPTCA